MKGGARSGAGRPRDPNALRRDRDPAGGVEWTILPVAGRKGRAPAWPLSKATARETALWRREWQRPQALVWEANGQDVEVALYVRCVASAEKPDALVGMRTLVRQMQDSLGISLPGLARNRWRIEVEDQPPPGRRAQTGSAARARFKVVRGGDAA